MLSLSVTSPSSSTLSFLPKPLQFKTSFNGTRLLQPNTFTIPAKTKRTALVPVMTGRREEQLKEIRSKSTEEINEEVVTLQGELTVLRLQKSAFIDINESDIPKMRKTVARLLTVKREREIEEGISKRLSRKLDKRWKRSIVVKPPPSVLKLLEKQAAEEAEEAQKAARRA